MIQSSSSEILPQPPLLKAYKNLVRACRVRHLAKLAQIVAEAQKIISIGSRKQRLQQQLVNFVRWFHPEL